MSKAVCLGVLTLSAITAARPQFVLFSLPFSDNCVNVTGSTWTSLLRDLQSTVTNGTSDAPLAPAMAFGAHVLLNVLNCDPGTLANQTQGLLDAAVATRVPVFLGLDAQVWWERRPDLWNWYNASAPGYDPANMANVEWTNWSSAAALRGGWLNWGRQMRMVPPQNIHAPAVMAATRVGFGAVGRVVSHWLSGGSVSGGGTGAGAGAGAGDGAADTETTARRDLLAGIKVGCEAGIGWQVWAYPGANALFTAYPGLANDAHDPRYGPNHSANPEPPTWGLQQIGFAAATAAGMRAQAGGQGRTGTRTSRGARGALSNSQVEQLTHWYLSNLTRYMIDAGVPSSVLLTHYGGTLVPRAGGAPTMPYAGGALPGVSLGVSLYTTPLDLVPSFAPLATRAEGWGAVEFGLADFWTPNASVPVGSTAAWLAAFRRTLALGNCRLVSQVPTSPAAVAAAQQLLFRTRTHADAPHTWRPAAACAGWREPAPAPFQGSVTAADLSMRFGDADDMLGETSPYVLELGRGSRLVFCAAAKTGSSGWKHLWLRLHGVQGWNASGTDVHAYRYRQLRDFTVTEATALLRARAPTVVRAAFVRDPALRVLSAWLDKVRGIAREGRTAALAMCRSLGLGREKGSISQTGSADEHATCVKRMQALSFAEFLAVLQRRPAASLNQHWNLQSVNCDLGKFGAALHFVGRTEHLQRDAACLLQGLGGAYFEELGASGWADVSAGAATVNNAGAGISAGDSDGVGVGNTPVPMPVPMFGEGSLGWRHRTEAAALAPRLFASRPELLRMVKEIYAADYAWMQHGDETMRTILRGWL